jgi:hypothetical protein
LVSAQGATGSWARFERGGLSLLAAGRGVRLTGGVRAVAAGRLSVEKNLEARLADDVGATAFPGISIGRDDYEFARDDDDFSLKGVKGLQDVFRFPIRAHALLPFRNWLDNRLNYRHLCISKGKKQMGSGMTGSFFPGFFDLTA